MPIFTVHVPPGVADPKRRADAMIVLRDGFSWPAFWFGPLALAYRRLWLAALGWIVIAALILFTSHALQVSRFGTAALFVLLDLLTGMEARGLRQAWLARRGYIFAALLASPDRDAAERTYFHGEGLRAAPRSALPAPVGSPTEVIGLFPRPGGMA